MSNEHPKLLATWEYIGEVLAASLLTLLVRMITGASGLSQWLIGAKSDLFVLLGIAAGLGVAIFAAFLGLLSSDFGMRLRLAGQAKAYTAALALPIPMFLLAFFALLALENAHSVWLAWLSLVLLIYSLLNLLTMLKNVYGLVSIWQAYDRARKLGRRD